MTTPSTIIREMIEDRKYKRENFGVSEEELAEEKILEEALDRIEKETGWISVEERLPEKNMRCMIYASYQPDFAFFREGKFYKCGTNEEYSDVELWSNSPRIPLPQNQ